MSTVIIAGSALAIAMSFILHKLSKSKRNFLDKVAHARIYNPEHVKKDYLPVAVFVGGTGGLGKALAEKYAYYTQGNACIVIAGRNQKAAEDIIASFPKPTHPDARHEFVYIDATLISSAKAAAASLRERLSKVNYLVVSPGFLSSKGRTETSEGIDRKLAAHYYTRWTVINELLPLLHAAKEKGEDAKALSILAPGHGGAMNLDDLGLKKTYSVKNAALQMPSYNDMMVEEFASRNPSLTFIHSAPGLVRTGLFANSDSRFLRLVGPLWWFFTSLSNISPDEFAEATLAGILKSGPGALRMRSDGDDMGKEAYYGSDEARTKVWEHTKETIKVL